MQNELMQGIEMQLTIATSVKECAEEMIDKNGLAGAVAVLVIPRERYDSWPGCDSLSSLVPVIMPIGSTMINCRVGHEEHDEYSNFYGECNEKIAYMLRTGTGEILNEDHNSVYGECVFNKGRRLFVEERWFVLVALCTNQPDKNDRVVTNVAKGLPIYSIL